MTLREFKRRVAELPPDVDFLPLLVSGGNELIVLEVVDIEIKSSGLFILVSGAELN